MTPGGQTGVSPHRPGHTLPDIYQTLVTTSHKHVLLITVFITSKIMNIITRSTGLLIAFVLLAGCAENGSVTDAKQDTQPVQQEQLGDLDRIHSVGDLYIASQPSVSDLEKLKEQGILSVINLRPADETPDMNEQKAVEDLGMKYVHIPLSGPGQADTSFFQSAREQLRSVKRPAFLHCSSANRAGMAWLAYRVLDEGVPLERALKEARKVGMRSQKLEDRALEYIKNH